ncbi:alpha/beta hydrolase [Mariniblastus sp.]|nr:alpha/beta hydrolase [Mariniblastus sp.]MDB4385922.1 alpha/beta hydrolase [bacterium]
MSTTPKKTWLRIVIGCFICYFLLCVLMFFLQRSLLYFPSRHSDATQLSPWVQNSQTIGYSKEVSSPDVVWLMLHGNAGQASDRGYILKHMSSRDSLYVLEYPGYGRRDGSPSQSTIDAAARDAYQSLRSRFRNTPVCIIGESIGTGPASMLANCQPAPDKIVLITPFDTLYRVAARKFFALPVWLLLRDRWDNIAALQGYDGEVTIYAAKGDEIIPIRHAETLAEAYPDASFHTISGGHNDWSRSAEVIIAK